MTLPLEVVAVLTKLARHLYSFLPGTPHPYGADKTTSFQGVAALLGLQQYWIGGSKQPAIERLLSSVLEYRPEKFCDLILEIVRCGIRYRGAKNDPITVEDVETVNKLLAEIGFKIPELHAPKFLNTLPKRRPSQGTHEVSPELLASLERQLVELGNRRPQDRGYEFQRFLGQLFEVFGLAPRSAFRIVGEEIDGSFEFKGETYLMEAKWQAQPVGATEMLAFSAKVSGKAEWSRGLMVSYAGFSEEGLAAFATGRRTNIICMSGLDLHYVLGGGLDLRVVLERKVRRAAETNEAYVCVRDLFPNLQAI